MDHALGSRARRILRAVHVAAALGVSCTAASSARAQVAPSPQIATGFSTKPTVTSVGVVGTNGGRSAILGTNFLQSSTDVPTIDVFLSGYPGTATHLTVAFLSSTSMTGTLAAGSYAAGSYTMVVTFPNSYALILPGAFTITTALTFAAIYGSCLVGDWPASVCTCSGTCITGSAVVTCPDTSGGGQDFNVLSPAAPTVKLNDPLFQQPNVTSLVMSHSGNSGLERATFTFTSGTAFGFYIGAYTTTAPAFTLLAQYLPPSSAPNENINLASGTGIVAAGWGGVAATTTAASLDAGTIFGSTYSNTPTVSMLVNNAVSASAAGPAGASVASGGLLALAHNHNAGSSTYDGHIAETLALACIPSTLQNTETSQTLNDTYGITIPPGFAQATTMPALTSNAPLRVRNSLTNYAAATTASLVLGGTVSACTTQSTSTTQWLDLLCPSLAAGTYDLLLENPDGQSITYPNTIAVTATTNYWSIFGLNAIGIYIPQAANLTCTPSPCISGTSLCSAWLDLAALQGTTLAQSITADQPTWFSGVSDATCNNQPYLAWNGTTTYLTLSSLLVDTPSAFWVGAVHQVGATGGTTSLVRFNAAGSLTIFQFTSTNTPEFFGGGSDTAWTGAVTGTQSMMGGATTGTPGTVSINVANGTAQTGSRTVGSFATSGVVEVGRNTNLQYNNGKTCALLFLNAQPTSPQLSAKHTLDSSTYGTP